MSSGAIGFDRKLGEDDRKEIERLIHESAKRMDGSVRRVEAAWREIGESLGFLEPSEIMSIRVFVEVNEKNALHLARTRPNLAWPNEWYIDHYLQALEVEPNVAPTADLSKVTTEQAVTGLPYRDFFVVRRVRFRHWVTTDAGEQRCEWYDGVTRITVGDKMPAVASFPPLRSEVQR